MEDSVTTVGRVQYAKVSQGQTLDLIFPQNGCNALKNLEYDILLNP